MIITYTKVEAFSLKFNHNSLLMGMDIIFYQARIEVQGLRAFKHGLIYNIVFIPALISPNH